MASLIEQLDEVFEQDASINELGIIFSGSAAPSSDAKAAEVGRLAPFQTFEHKLGFSAEHLLPLAHEARREYCKARSAYKDACEAAPGESNAALCPSVTRRLMSTTRALLLVNADHNSVWNARKTLVLRGVTTLNDEIRFLNLLFTKHSKSPNAWSHRRWCWTQALSATAATSAATTSDVDLAAEATPGDVPVLSLQAELAICTSVAELYPKNYYAWSQRIWVVRQHLYRAKGPTGAKESLRVLEEERGHVEAWLSRHVSDHSALNHRKNLLRLTFGLAWASAAATTATADSATTTAAGAAAAAAAAGAIAATSKDDGASNCGRNGGGEGIRDDAAAETAEDVSTRGGEAQGGKRAVFAILTEELELSGQFITRYPGHESLWCYRRFVCQSWLATLLHDAAGRAAWRSEREDAGWPAWLEPLRLRLAGLLGVYTVSDHAAAGDGGSSSSSDGDGSSNDSGGTSYPGADSGTDGDALVGGLMMLLAGEAAFAVGCAVDGDSWDFDKQRRHALTHLCFLTWMVARADLHLGSSDEPPPPAAAATVAATDKEESVTGAYIGGMSAEWLPELVLPPALAIPVKHGYDSGEASTALALAMRAANGFAAAALWHLDLPSMYKLQ